MEAAHVKREVAEAWLEFYDTYKPTQVELQRLVNELVPLEDES